VPGPQISVVVATHDRPLRLARLLAGLRAQTLAPDRFEVVVVNDGSGPATADVLAAPSEAGALALHTVRHERALGPGAARNTGWRAAQAPLIAFTDDDCVPTARWLEEILLVHRAHPRAVIQGPTQPDPAELPGAGVFSRTVEIRGLGPQYETCNIAYPRETLDALGGFDERFGLRPGGEDTDLAWRAIATGHPTVFAQEAAVHHAVERLGPLGKLRVASRWTETMRIFAEHPQTRKMLTRGMFWNVWHYLLLRSLLALALPAWARRFLIARHLIELRRRAHRDGAGSWAIPYLLVHDLIEFGSVARGAIRYRTPVL
jgi:GT2 family glycosyltransferase